MALLPARYRASRFREKTTPRNDTDRYLMDEAIQDDPRMRRLTEFEQNLVRSHIDRLPAGALVADVPCGNGRMSQWVARRPDLRLVALDYGLEMLQSVSRRGIPALLPRRVRADVTMLPLPDKSVDLLINMRLMHHIPDRATQVAMYRQIARATRGTVITSFWTTHAWRYLRRRLLGKPIRGFPVSPDHFRQVCAEAGLIVEKIVPTRRWYEEQCLAICRPG